MAEIGDHVATALDTAYLSVLRLVRRTRPSYSGLLGLD
jgi:hypothetical protein